jgi:hypothetical protein
MNKKVKDDITRILQREYLRRSLVKYFNDKGYDKTFEICAYPPSLQDLNEQSFSNKTIEVAYNIEDIDLIDNTIKVAWNMFILGNKRIFLGYTDHKNFTDIQNNRNVIKDFNGPISIKKIIDVIVDFIGDSSNIYDINKKSGQKMSTTPLMGKY